MARVTIEDCSKKIPSRFKLVVLAAQRAKEIASGAKPIIERDNDKNPVIALREIATDAITADTLKELFIRKLQRRQVTLDQDLPDENDFSEEIKGELQKFEKNTSEDELEDMYHDEEDISEEEINS